MLSEIFVTDYMAVKLITFHKDTNVLDAIKKMMNYKITSAPVLDNQGQLIGMLSERDCIKIVIDAAYNQATAGKVGDYMSTEVISVDCELSILQVAEKFNSTSVRSFPVFQDVDLVGVISRSDVLRAIVATQC